MKLYLLKYDQTLCSILISLGQLLIPVDLLFYGFKILQLKFDIDDLLIAHRINTSIHMHDIIIIKATQYVNDRISAPDVSEKLVTQTFALAGAFHQSGYIYDLDRSWYYFLGLYNFFQLY